MAIECYELKITAKLAQQDVLNVLHYNVDNDTDATSAALAGQLIQDWFLAMEGAWLGILPPDYELRHLYARRVIGGSGDGVWQEFPGGTTNGTLGTHTGPAAISPIIKLYGGMTDPYQGRIFLPGIAENMIVDDIYQAAWIAASEDLIATIGSIAESAKTFTLAIRRRSNNTSQDVTSMNVSPIRGLMGSRRTPG